MYIKTRRNDPIPNEILQHRKKPPAAAAGCVCVCNFGWLFSLLLLVWSMASSSSSLRRFPFFFFFFLLSLLFFKRYRSPRNQRLCYIESSRRLKWTPLHSICTPSFYFICRLFFYYYYSFAFYVLFIFVCLFSLPA